MFSLFLVTLAVVCISVSDSSPIGPRWNFYIATSFLSYLIFNYSFRWRARRLRNRTEGKVEDAPVEEKKEEKVEAAAPEEGKKEEKAFDFGTLAAEEAPKEGKKEEAAPAAKEEAKPKKAAKAEEAEEAEEAEGLSAEGWIRINNPQRHIWWLLISEMII